MLTHRRGRKAGIASYLCKIEHLTIGESRRCEKPGESRKPSNEAFGLDLFV